MKSVVELHFPRNQRVVEEDGRTRCSVASLCCSPSYYFSDLIASEFQKLVEEAQERHEVVSGLLQVSPEWKTATPMAKGLEILGPFPIVIGDKNLYAWRNIEEETK